jgi:hypothetical protein
MASTNWNTRLEVSRGGKTISPITAFSPTYNTMHDPVHSIEQDNIGFIRKPQTFTFTMTLPAIGPAVAELLADAIAGTEFEISVAEKQGDDWAFKSLKFTRCIVTNASPSNIVIDGAPQATFTCACLAPGIEQGAA